MEQSFDRNEQLYLAFRAAVHTLPAEMCDLRITCLFWGITPDTYSPFLCEFFAMFSDHPEGLDNGDVFTFPHILALMQRQTSPFESRPPTAQTMVDSFSCFYAWLHQVVPTQKDLIFEVTMKQVK